jgi:glycine/D-amino acid oxidase-like deaminating enzyme
MNQRSVMDIVVLGGGTAGWLTALYAKIVMPTKRITVIESDEIGIFKAEIIFVSV